MNGGCTELWFNWRQVSDGDLSGDDYDICIVGENGVVEIFDNTASDGTYLVTFEDGKRQKIYNPNRAFFKGV